MQRWGMILAAVFFAASLLGLARAATPPEPSPLPAPAPANSSPGPKRPERTMKFEDRPAIPWAELQFADDEVQRAARQFHEFAESLVTKPGQAQRYKDMTSSNMPNYMGIWTILEKDRRMSLSLHGQTIEGADRFHHFQAESQARVGIWSAEWSIHVWPKTSPYKTSVSVFLREIVPLNDSDPRTSRTFWPTVRGTGAELKEGSLNYRLGVRLPPSDDPKRFVRMMYGSPEEFLQLNNEDTESLRKMAKQEKTYVATYYDESEVSSAKPPRELSIPMTLKPEMRIKFDAAVDTQLDRDLEMLKADYRDMHQAIQLALPRELYESIEQPGK